MSGRLRDLRQAVEQLREAMSPGPCMAIVQTYPPEVLELYPPAPDGTLPDWPDSEYARIAERLPDGRVAVEVCSGPGEPALVIRVDTGGIKDAG